MDNRQLVLVAVDRATAVERAMAFGVRIAKARGADLHALHVAPHGAMHVDDRADRWAFGPDRDGVRVRRVTLRGEPAHVIPAYAQLHQAALLVIERDYGSSRLWRNSRVVHAMVNRSPAPLLVLPPRRATDGDESVPRRILTPVDFSVASAVALRTAVDLAGRHGARLTLLHTLSRTLSHLTFSGGGAWEVVRRLPAQREAAAERLRRIAAYFGAEDVDTEVATGLADIAILDSAGRSDHDLVVMGTAQRSWLDRGLFGSTLRRVLRRATVPILVVPVVAGAHAWPNEHLVHQFQSQVDSDPVGRAAA